MVLFHILLDNVKPHDAGTRDVRTWIFWRPQNCVHDRRLLSTTIRGRPQTCSASLSDVSYSRVISLHNDPLVHHPSEEGVSLLRERFHHEFAILRHILQL